MTQASSKYILCIDPGIRFCGYVLFDDSGKIVESKTIKFNTKLSQSKRLFELYSELSNVSSEYDISNVITEYQFVDIMSSIVGVIMAFSGSINDAEFLKMTPSQWKKLATGKGNIEEKDLRDKMIDVYPDAENFDEHRIDCIGIYIAYQNKLKEGISDVKSAKRSNSRKKASKS